MGDAGSTRLEILVVDDDESVREVLALCLERDDHGVTLARNTEEAMVKVKEGLFDLAFVDLRLGAESGLDLIPRLLGQAPWMKVVLITAHSSVETAVEAMRKGASDYLTKPVDPHIVRVLVERMASIRRLERRVEALEDQMGRASPRPLLESRNPAMRRVVEMARRVAKSDALVLIRGESGTGKGVVAREIHAASDRAQSPFSVINCPSLSAELLQSELFGHVKGAFTGAVKTQAGKIDLTEGGTLFLDEIGDLPGSIQPKLLRFVQDREYERVGDPQPRQANVRIISATNRNLEEAVAEGEFREDLLYRLNVIELTVPPLRARPEDVEDLSHRFLRFFAHKYNQTLSDFSPSAWEWIRSHRWPGNVREMQNAVERAVILCTTREVPRELFPDAAGPARFATPKAPTSAPTSAPTPTSPAPTTDAPDADAPSPASAAAGASLEELERDHISRVLHDSDTLEAAAETLGIAPSTLWRKRRKYDL